MHHRHASMIEVGTSRWWGVVSKGPQVDPPSGRAQCPPKNNKALHHAAAAPRCSVLAVLTEVEAAKVSKEVLVPSAENVHAAIVDTRAVTDSP